MLRVQPVSKAQARQRLGRAGRECSGTCYRLYTEDQFDKLQEMTTPEIQRCNLASVLLQLIALGINDVENFDFMDKPDENAIQKALEQLSLLEAVEKQQDGYKVHIIIIIIITYVLDFVIIKLKQFLFFMFLAFSYWSQNGKLSSRAQTI